MEESSAKFFVAIYINRHIRYLFLAVKVLNVKLNGIMSYFLPSLLPECSAEAAALSGHKMKTAELKVIFIFIL